MNKTKIKVNGYDIEVDSATLNIIVDVHKAVSRAWGRRCEGLRLEKLADHDFEKMLVDFDWYMEKADIRPDLHEDSEYNVACGLCETIKECLDAPAVPYEILCAEGLSSLN